MPRWIFVLFCIAIGLSVVGSLLIVLHSPNALPPVTNAARPPS